MCDATKLRRFQIFLSVLYHIFPYIIIIFHLNHYKFIFIYREKNKFQNFSCCFLLYKICHKHNLSTLIQVLVHVCSFLTLLKLVRIFNELTFINEITPSPSSKISFFQWSMMSLIAHLKSQVNIFYQNLSIVRRCCKLFIFLLSSTPGPLHQFHQTWSQSSDSGVF